MASDAGNDTNCINDGSCQSDAYFTCSRSGKVKIHMGNDGSAAIKPVTVPEVLQRNVEKYPDHPALVFKDSNGAWESLNYREYQQKVHHIAKAFIKLGLEPRNSVGIVAFNCPEWFCSELAAIHAGAISAGIYTTNSPHGVWHVLHTSNANIAIVDDADQMEKILQIRDKLKDLKAVVQINGILKATLSREEGYYKWSDLEDVNVDDVEEEFQRRLANICANECCCLIYTSGTTGDPKPAMLSHDNITWDAFLLGKSWGFAREVIVTYLPLSHIAAKIIDIFVGLVYATTVYFADRHALKNTLVKTLCEVRPTRFGGVPRVYEKIHEKFVDNARKSPRLQNMILNYVRSVVLDYNMKKLSGEKPSGWMYSIAQKLVINRVKGLLGLDRCETFIVGGAPLSTETKKYFMSLDMPIQNAYGMSEGSAFQVSSLDEYDYETTGKPFDGVEMKVHNPDSNGHGELCSRGRNVFMGYLDDEEKTRETLDEERWLHTGDIGYINSKGLVYITSRLKELIITAGGENVPPKVIEDAIVAEIPALGHALVVGDQRKFLVVLVTLKTETDPQTGAPTDQLHQDALEWLEDIHVKYSTLSDVLNAGPCPKVLQGIQEGINRANKKALSNAQRVQKFAILKRDFSVATGELGPTLKVKRNVVIKMYEDVIEGLYKN